MSKSLDLPENCLAPESCQTMVDVRHGVDALDVQLVELLERRFGYMRAAARIKNGREEVRDEERKRVVIDNAVAKAAQCQLPAALVGELWELLVEGSIAYELQTWDQTRG